MPGTNVLQIGQLPPLDVVVEVARLVGEGEVDSQRVLKDLEEGAPAADPQAAELGAVLEVADGVAADLILTEVDLVGLHLPAEDEQRLLGVVGFLLLGRVSGLVLLCAQGLDLLLEPVEVFLQPLDDCRRGGDLLRDHGHLSVCGRLEREQARRGDCHTSDEVNPFTQKGEHDTPAGKHSELGELPRVLHVGARRGFPRYYRHKPRRRMSLPRLPALRRVPAESLAGGRSERRSCETGPWRRRC